MRVIAVDALDAGQPAQALLERLQVHVAARINGHAVENHLVGGGHGAALLVEVGRDLGVGHRLGHSRDKGLLLGLEFLDVLLRFRRSHIQLAAARGDLRSHRRLRQRRGGELNDQAMRVARGSRRGGIGDALGARHGRREQADQENQDQQNRQLAIHVRLLFRFDWRSIEMTLRQTS